MQLVMNYGVDLKIFKNSPETVLKELDERLKALTAIMDTPQFIHIIQFAITVQ